VRGRWLGKFMLYLFKLVFIFTLIVASAIVVWSMSAIPQPVEYHQFADQRKFLGIPNFANVVSNLIFIFFGIYALFVIWFRSVSADELMSSASIYIFYLGLIAIGATSAYYHWSPSNDGLLWDRLAMSISFMALFSFILSAHFHQRVGSYLLMPLMVLGVASVVYWYYTESLGQGDLRAYLLVQFLPVILIPFILLLFPSKKYQAGYIWLVLLIYILAKLAEHYDAQIMHALVEISGHSIKHILSALAAMIFLKSVLSTSHRS
jgi:hypothetical protein